MVCAVVSVKVFTGNGGRRRVISMCAAVSVMGFLQDC